MTAEDFRSQLKALFSDAISRRLREEIVEEILPKPSIAELERMIEEAEKEGTAMPSLMSSGELMRTTKRPVFAADLADAVLSAMDANGFYVVRKVEA